MAAMSRFYPNWWLVADVRHPFFAASRPLVFAHRGGSGLAPENTIAAFETGVALGADGLELDVRLSRDGVVVVHHDASLDRTTTLGAASTPVTRPNWRVSMPATISGASPRGLSIRAEGRASACRRSRLCWRASATLVSSSS